MFTVMNNVLVVVIDVAVVDAHCCRRRCFVAIVSVFVLAVVIFSFFFLFIV